MAVVEIGEDPRPQELPPGPASAKRAGFLYRRSGIWTVRIAMAILVFGSWQLYASHVSKFLDAPPSSIVKAAWRQLVTQHTIWSPLLSSLEALFLGYAISLAIGIPVGIAMGRWRKVESVLAPYVSFLYVLPHVAFISLMVIWFGFGLKFRLAYVVVSAVWPIIINTMVGAKNVDQGMLDVGRSVCASERKMLRTIVLPSAIPYMLIGARQAFFLSWIGVIVAEVLSTQTGLGGVLTHYSDYYQTADMFVPIVLIMVIGVLIQSASNRVQRWIAPWSNTAGSR
ncbi:MAG TPA: ABC transporter permease [Solirubrobacteraceae bacterium]|nr:ABC transporter permease [Solirubrobacteraceae bacterium]